MKNKLIGFYDYTVILTYCGMLSAFCGICLVLAENYLAAVVCLLLAGVCDMFDGAVARTKDRNDQEKKFGIQIDSLSDLISFGVFPGLFTYCISGKKPYAGVISALYVLCALIRLAYFNVMEEERQSETDERRTSYQGLPVTSIAAILPLFYILYGHDIITSVTAFVFMALVVAVSFVLNISIPKPHGIFMKILVGVGIVELVGLILLAIA